MALKKEKQSVSVFLFLVKEKRSQLRSERFYNFAYESIWRGWGLKTDSVLEWKMYVLLICITKWRV